MELKVTDIKEIQPIQFNYEELKEELTVKTEHYKTAVYTEETINIAKQDRANLNKLSKAINDEKIKQKNKLLESYIPFENQCKELMLIVDAAVQNIDIQVKAFEEKEKDAKLQEIVAYFAEKVGVYEGLIDFDLIYNPKWLNKTYEMKNVQLDIDSVIGKTKNDMMTINGFIKDEDILKQAQDYYFKNINQSNILGATLHEAERIEQNNRRLQELKQKEEVEKNSQNIIKSEQNIVQNEQNVQNNLQEVVKQEQNIEIQLQQIDFRVWVTPGQKALLREFLINNKIKYGGVPKNA